MNVKTIVVAAVAGLCYWGYTIYKDGGDPATEITETISKEAKDFSEGFKKGWEESKAPGGEISYPANITERLELPRLNKGSGQYFVTHEADGDVNYSLEYDADRHHARWVAFTFDSKNCQDRTGRMDTWAWDPKLPNKLSTEYDFKNSGYSRGHLVASEDRVANKEANKQTFYYSNISPQLQSHNGGVWNRLEKRVRAWGRNNDMRRVLYVAKGGTIKDGQIEPKRVRNKIVVPKYYWMALLAEDLEGKYHAIAFLTEHRDYAKGEDNLQKLALSVDELEDFTGLDFFHNLDDSIEDEVEAIEPLSREARRYWW